MKNKRGQAAIEFLMTYGWAILAAIIVIGVLAIYFRPPLLQDDFIISKQECREELDYRTYGQFTYLKFELDANLPDRDIYALAWKKIRERNINFVFVRGEEINVESINETEKVYDVNIVITENSWEEICEQVEVEEIRYDAPRCTGICSIKVSVDGETFKKLQQRIEKQDLTRDWLDENAKPQKPLCQYRQKQTSCAGIWRFNEYIIEVKKT